ncbi:MAG: zinc dependent phospholipase C family protein [Bacteroidota bacterium]
MPRLYKYIVLVIVITAIRPQFSKAYSILAHEAVIDATWDKSILPLLKLKYPGSPVDSLKKARSFAYGGSLTADMGYFPLGNPYFTNLVHYVRSGDFVAALLSESQNLFEYAFSLGALAHYMTDKYGHSLGTNVAVPIVYPKMKKFGNVVTYDDDPTSHKRMEFAFDVLQIARGNYLPQSYHNFIGFQVAQPVLERAFLKTYGQKITSVFVNFPLAVATFRWSVKRLLPALTRTAWVIKGQNLIKTNPGMTAKKFRYRMKRKEYEAAYGKDREKPGITAVVLSLIIRISPKIGPLKSLKFKDPGPEGEKLFIKGFDSSVSDYEAALNKLQRGRATFTDIDFDTGKVTAPGEYGLADKTYSDLVIKLAGMHFDQLTYPLKENILHYYQNPAAAEKFKKPKSDRVDIKKTNEALQELKTAKPVNVDDLRI